MLVTAALAITALTGLFLVGLGVLTLARPAPARRFSLGFATSPGKHYLELAVRLLLGAAFVIAAPSMVGSSVVQVAGWVLLGTTAVMLFIPWRVHRAFAQRTVPQALRYLPWMGLASFVGGGALLWAVIA